MTPSDSKPLPHAKPPRLLLGCVLIDPRGWRSARQLGKVLASSLMRHFFYGDIVLWRNFKEPLYLVERRGLHEIVFQPDAQLNDEQDARQVSQECKQRLAQSLAQQAENYDWVILCDMHVLGLRNLDHLFANRDTDILAHKLPDGTIDPSFIAVRSTSYAEFLESWSASSSNKNQAAQINDAINNPGLRTQGFERGEVVNAFDSGTGLADIMEAAVVLLSGAKPAKQTKAAFALHMMRTFGDKDGLFLDLMES